MGDEGVSHAPSLARCAGQIIELLLFNHWVMAVLVVRPQIQPRHVSYYKALVSFHIKPMMIKNTTTDTVIWLEVFMIDQSVADIECVVGS